MPNTLKKPRKRSALRLKLGASYYSFLRHLLWFKMRHSFATSQVETPLPYCCFRHQSILLRELKDVDMWLQHNKVINLKIATKQLNGILLKPGETFSYWKCIGKPSKRKGYVDGMVLQDGAFYADTGGGLCQLSNLIFWMTVHTPLTVLERHRHGYDVFPDANRTQPFGSGATCFYPYGDLMIRNDTPDDYQLFVVVGPKNLEGEWRCSNKPMHQYRVIEKNHEMKSEPWGGYSRHNELYQQKLDENGRLLEEKRLVKNAAIMMYAPFLSDHRS